MPSRNASDAEVFCDEKDANRYVSKSIPWIILAIFAYASYIVTKPLCIDYLLSPRLHQYDRDPRVGTGIAILVVFYVLLLLTIITYLRLVITVAFCPDYLPRGANWAPIELEHESWLTKRRKRSEKAKLVHAKATSPGNHEKFSRRNASKTPGIELQTTRSAYPLDENGQEEFWMKDIYVCQDDGRPVYCSTCCQFKTDRSHHNRDSDRCVRKLDHFCPWVGGVVSETSYKFFLQFVIYTAFFTSFCLIVFAIFIAEHRSDTGRVNAQWAVGLGLAAFFLFFSSGMSGTSLQLASINSTTIENINRKDKVWILAVYLSPQQYENMRSCTNDHRALTFPTVTFPTHSPPKSADNSTASSSEVESRHEPVHSVVSTSGTDIANNSNTKNMRMFAILRTQPGENPFDLGDPIKNLRQVIGHTLWDWLLPIRVAPCVNHSSTVSAYPMGPVVDRLKREAGILSEDVVTDEEHVQSSQ